jgi:hypothetical protein
MNVYENNKKVLAHSPNYYKIINEEFDEDDQVTCKLLQVFSKFVELVDINDKDLIKTLEKADEVMMKYFTIDDFRRELTKALSEMKIRKNVENVIVYVMKCLNTAYEKFLESYTRNLYIPKWI